MEQKLVYPTIKNLFVVLIRESLEDLKCKNEECNKYNQGIANDVSCNNAFTKEPRRVTPRRPFLPNSTQISPGKKQKLPLRTLNMDIVQNVVYKECVTILQKLDVNNVRQTEDMFQRELVPVSRRTLINTLNDPKESTSKLQVKSKINNAQLTFANFCNGGDQTDKHIFSDKLPIYKQIIIDQSKTNNDQYEFDELDSDKFKDTNAIKCKLNKKKKVNFSKCVSRVNKKRHRPDTKRANTYDTIIQEIVQKVMKKVQHGKFENNNLILENNVSDTCKQDHILPNMNMKDDNDLYNNKMDNVIPIQPEQNDENDGEHNNSDDNSKGSKQNDENDDEKNNSDDYYLYSPISSRKRIKIINNIILNNEDTSFFFEDAEPNANSTVISSVKKSNPWRFGSNLKRNPHYLSIKKTALPCLQQDMILDYNLLKEIEKDFGKTSKKVENPEKEIVLPETEFVSETNNKENVPQLSLFDNEDFIAAQEKSPDNLSIKKQKRNILGLISQNTANIARPKNILGKSIAQVQTLPRQKVLEKSNTEEKLNVNINTAIDDKTDNVPRQEVLEKSNTEEKLDGNINTDINNKTDDAPKLFEDEEPNFNFNESSKIYIPRVRKKKKILLDNNGVLNRDKNEMTKTEQAELEQWAAKFNSMCEEIENYTLELE